MCKIWSVFHQYLRIGQFVWALVVCGPRYYQSASLDCSGVTQKIHMQNPEIEQAPALDAILTEFRLWGR